MSFVSTASWNSKPCLYVRRKQLAKIWCHCRQPFNYKRANVTSNSAAQWWFAGYKQFFADLSDSRMWLQHMNMTDILRKFLKAERTGHWKLHLRGLNSMLPHLTSGHNLYTKSVIYLYLQDIDETPAITSKCTPIFYKDTMWCIEVMASGMDMI